MVLGHWLSRIFVTNCVRPYEPSTMVDLLKKRPLEVLQYKIWLNILEIYRVVGAFHMVALVKKRQYTDLVVFPAYQQGGVPKSLFVLLPKSIFVLLPKSLFVLLPKSLFVLLPKSLFVLLPKSLFVLLPKSLFVLLPKSLFVLLPKSLFVLLPKRPLGSCKKKKETY